MRATIAFLATATALLASTACSSTVPAPTAAFSQAATKPSAMPDAKTVKGPLIYVAAANQVLLFSERGRNPGVIGIISDQVNSAYGLFVDGRRNLYVANQATVTAYHPGSVHPWIVYSDSHRPLYVVLDHAGRLYAGNQDGTVTEYPPRQTTPDITLQTPGNEADGINLDDANNLYVAYRGSSQMGSIEKFAPNSQEGHVLGMQLDAPQALQLDRSRNILVVETGKEAVDVFPPGKTVPSQVIHVDNGVTQIALRESERYMYISNYINGDVYISRYPQAQFRKKISDKLMYVQGMALSNEER
jgi:hypothetical protein